MDVLSINTLRIVLVGMTALAALAAMAFGMWNVAAVLWVGVAAHGAMWMWLATQRRAEHERLHQGVAALLRDEG